MRGNFIMASILLIVSVRLDAQFHITTVAGNGSAQTSGDNGQALCAGVMNPTGVCSDDAGNIYIASSNCIRKVDASTGIISRIAGSDTYNSTGDGGQAINATFRSPYTVAVDHKNNIYVVEYGSNKVRKIAPDGIITTFAGTGGEGYTGDGGLAINAKLSTPLSADIDSKGNVYVADFGNSVIRKIDVSTGVIETIAGNGTKYSDGDGGPALSAGLGAPISVCFDKFDNMYILDVRTGTSSKIRKVDKATGLIHTIAGSALFAHTGDGGLAKDANLLDPVSIDVDNDNNVFVVEYDEPRIRMISATSGIITTIAGNGVNAFNGDGGEALLGSLSSPRQLSIRADGALLVADQQNQRIRILSLKTLTQVYPYSQAKITISPALPCKGSNVVIKATITNPGDDPIFQWKVNGAIRGTNSNEFSSKDLKENDTVVCIYSSKTCAGRSETSSDSIVIHYKSGLSPKVTLTSSSDSLCPGSIVLTKAIGQNIPSSAHYKWFKNNASVGGDSSQFQYIAEAGTDMIFCIVSGINDCSLDTLHSDMVNINVFNTPKISLYPSDSTVVAGTSIQLHALVDGNVKHFDWSPPSLVTNNSLTEPFTVPLKESVRIAFNAETDNGCKITKYSDLKVAIKWAMPNAFTPNGDGRNDIFKIPNGVIIDLKKFELYDRWGKRIFSTNDVTRGWTGDSYDSGTYIYSISFIDNGRQITLKGSFVLLR